MRHIIYNMPHTTKKKPGIVNAMSGFRRFIRFVCMSNPIAEYKFPVFSVNKYRFATINLACDEFFTQIVKQHSLQSSFYRACAKFWIVSLVCYNPYGVFGDFEFHFL